jgi:hypothetical protein
MSRLADAAFDWLRQHGNPSGVSSDDLWAGMEAAYPELTAVTPTRRTPRTTLMRDLRKDRAQRFVVGGRRVSLRQ